MENLERRVTVLERAIIGEIDKPGILEMQRDNAREIGELKRTLHDMSGNLRGMSEAHEAENNIRLGEQKMLKTFRNLAYALIALLGLGGGLLGSRILAVLDALQ